MKKFLEKIQIWHLLITMVIPVLVFAFSLGATNQTITNISVDVTENRKMIIKNQLKIESGKTTDNKVDQLNKRLDETIKAVNEAKKEILEIYKNR